MRTIGQFRREIWFLLSMLIIAVLACTRSEVAPPRGIGSGGVPTATQVSVTLSPSPSPVPATPSATLEPILTQTPYEPEPLVSPTFPPTPTVAITQEVESFVYEAQPGDALRAVAVRFGVVPEDISTANGSPVEQTGLIDPGTVLIIPRRLGATGPSEKLLPDSELVYSPHVVNFDLETFIQEQGGYLTQYREIIGKRWRSGAEIIAMAARDHSVNPRILLAFLEYYSGWVTNPENPEEEEFTYPLGHTDPQTMGLFRQLGWLSNALGTGYYEWRAGTLTELIFPDSSILRVAPDLNAATVALHYFFATQVVGREWAEAISPKGIMSVYRDLFGDPFAYTHPLYEGELEQPELILPFLPGHVWAFTGGPHGAWERESAWAALDFAPASVLPGCAPSEDWVVASAAGLVVRSGGGVIVLDLDGDGLEQTGWALLYLHIEDNGVVSVGDFLEQGDLIGHPSCDGGVATGTHLHFARKYNGEWILADGALPFVLSGWVAKAGAKAYQGALVKGDDVVLACPCASRETNISR